MLASIEVHVDHGQMRMKGIEVWSRLAVRHLKAQELRFT